MLSDFLRRVRMLAGRRRFNRELREEIELHASLRGDGRKFGNDLRLRELSQDAWGWRWLSDIGQDVRHGLRLLARTPTLTCVALLSLTLGIGANTALFSLADALLLRPLPVAAPEQLVEVAIQAPSGRERTSLSNPLWEQVRDHADVFSSAFAWSYTQFDLSRGGVEERVPALWASGGYFSTLGVRPEIGRLLNQQDDYPGCPGVLVISDGYWHSHYGASPQALGQSLVLNQHSFEIVGVSPPGFFGTEVGETFDLAAPLCAEALTDPRAMVNMRDAWWVSVMGRMRPDENANVVSRRLAVLGEQFLKATEPTDYTPKELSGYLSMRWSAHPAATGGMARTRQRYGLPLEILLVIAGVVLLVACANLAGLMLARAAARQPELAVRMALGASRTRLIRQLLTESLLLAFGGAGLGVVFALWAERGVEAGVSTSAQAVALNLSLNGRVLLFTLGAAIATGLLVGILPALRATDITLAARVRPRNSRQWHHVMVAAEIALSLLLAAGAGLFLRTFLNLATVNPGFDTNEVLLVNLNPPANHPAPELLRRTQAAALEHLRNLPGVESGSESFIVPTSQLQWDNQLRVVRGASAEVAPDVYYNVISPGYFATLRTPLLAGRDFRAGDLGTTTPVTIVNQSLAQQLFPQGTALGQWVQQGEEQHPEGPATQIVGIVADAKYSTLRETPPPTAYYPLAQCWHVFPPTAYELRSRLPVTTLEHEVEAAFAQFAPTATFRMKPMTDAVEGTLLAERLLARVSVLFGGLALLLTAIGLYGIMSYMVSERRREFGVRLALGARPRSIQRLVMREAAAIMGAGTAIGALATWILARELRAKVDGLLFGLRATDLSTLALAAVALALVALGAAAWPARRAAHTDPMASLREE